MVHVRRFQKSQLLRSQIERLSIAKATIIGASGMFAQSFVYSTGSEIIREILRLRSGWHWCATTM